MRNRVCSGTMGAMNTALKTAVACSAAVMLAACAAPRQQPTPEGMPVMSKVTGTVSYRSRIALPPTAVVHVQLADVSRADAPSVVIGRQSIETAGRQVQIPFEIAYDPAQIDPRMSLAVQARIESAGVLLFITDRRYPVAADGADAFVELELVAVPGSRP
jgi:putative lipoprotein